MAKRSKDHGADRGAPPREPTESPHPDIQETSHGRAKRLEDELRKELIKQGIDPDKIEAEEQIPPEFQKPSATERLKAILRAQREQQVEDPHKDEPIDPKSLVDASLRVITNIRVFMARAGEMSQKDLAAKAGLSQVTFSRILNHRRALQIDELEAIATALGLKPADLLTGAPLKREEAQDLIAMVTSPGLQKMMTEPMGRALKEIGVPESLRKFVEDNSYRLTPEEVDLLMSAGPMWIVREDPGDFYWRTLIRAHRTAMNWPPEEPPPQRKPKV